MPLPNSFLAHLRSAPYHPQKGAELGNVLSAAIVIDLLATCRPLASKAAAGEIVWDKNSQPDLRDRNVEYRSGDRSTPAGGCSTIRGTDPQDLTVLGAYCGRGQGGDDRASQGDQEPKRELESHHTHVHNYSGQAIAGGVLIVNIADRFKFRPSVNRAIALFTENRPSSSNIACRRLRRSRCAAARRARDWTPRRSSWSTMTTSTGPPAEDHERPPAPQIGDPMHYDGFIQRLCAEWRSRFDA